MSENRMSLESAEAVSGHAQQAFYRMADLIRITGLSRATLYRRIDEGRFPPPVHLGGRACGWRPAALQAWIDDPEGYAALRSERLDRRR